MASLKMSLLACALAVAPAVFASTQEPRAPSTAAPPGPATSERARNIARPIFFGLVAMAFLIASGLAAQSHRKARSRRGSSL